MSILAVAVILAVAIAVAIGCRMGSPSVIESGFGSLTPPQRRRVARRLKIRIGAAMGVFLGIVIFTDQSDAALREKPLQAILLVVVVLGIGIVLLVSFLRLKFMDRSPGEQKGEG